MKLHINIKNIEKNKIKHDILFCLHSLNVFYKKSNIVFFFYPRVLKKYTFLKSPFIFKSAREQLIKEEYKLKIILSLNEEYNKILFYKYLSYFNNIYFFSKINLKLKNKMFILKK